MAYTEIRAPYAGVVTQRHVQVGETVAPGTPLMTGASLDELRVVAEVPQSVIELVRAARKAAVYVDGRRIEATGITLFPAAQPETDTFRARIDLPKGVQGLSPGMFVKVGLVVGRGRAAAGAAVRRGRAQRDARRVRGRAQTAACRCGRCGSGTCAATASRSWPGLAGGERVALDPVAAGMLARQPRDAA